jgi:hypothetical protein
MLGRRELQRRLPTTRRNRLFQEHRAVRSHESYLRSEFGGRSRRSRSSRTAWGFDGLSVVDIEPDRASGIVRPDCERASGYRILVRTCEAFRFGNFRSTVIGVKSDFEESNAARHLSTGESRLTVSGIVGLVASTISCTNFGHGNSSCRCLTFFPAKSAFHRETERNWSN